MKKQRIIILGSTGSIGKNGLDIISRNEDRFEVVGLSANSNVDELQKQIEKWKPKAACLSDGSAYMRLKKTKQCQLLAGSEGLAAMIETVDFDILLSGIVGAAGLAPVLAAIRKGVVVALANKEPLVMAGGIMKAEAEENNALILPVDSEHSAIWQCLNGEPKGRVKKIILTASGGPFYKKSIESLKKVTVKQALKHPRWKMGPKITIDSSTMMNKGLEVIEAGCLFDMPPERIDVVIHPQSIVHSMVEYEDGSVIAQMGEPDMRVPISYALSYPDRWKTGVKPLNLADVGRLDFCPPDMKKFPCLQLAYHVLKKGNIFPATLNAANEVAVEAFIAGKIGYMDIPKIIEKTLSRIRRQKKLNLKSILDADNTAREIANQFI